MKLSSCHIPLWVWDGNQPTPDRAWEARCVALDETMHQTASKGCEISRLKTLRKSLPEKQRQKIEGESSGLFFRHFISDLEIQKINKDNIYYQ